jgi:hypothetical protein
VGWRAADRGARAEDAAVRDLLLCGDNDPRLLDGANPRAFLALASIFPLCAVWVPHAYRRDISAAWRLGTGSAAAALLACALFVNVSYEDPCTWTASHCEVRRDYAATVVSLGEGMKKRMLVNGIGITQLTPIAKFMAHLALSFHDGKPESALVICFGMGTTYRSLLSWGVTTTAVELVSSVRDALPTITRTPPWSSPIPRARS